MQSKCISFLAGGSGLQFMVVFQNVYIVLTVSNNKHSNIHFQFLSLCRLQQLAMTSRLTVVLVSLLLATAIVIFWLWLVIVPATVAQPCPLECECRKGAYSVRCSGPSITALPLIRYKDVQRLYLTENNITLLERDSFVSLTEIDILYVVSSRLRTIRLGHSTGLQS